MEQFPSFRQSGTWAFSITARTWMGKLLNMKEANKIKLFAASARP
jgi:hypothetical protein